MNFVTIQHDFTSIYETFHFYQKENKKYADTPDRTAFVPFLAHRRVQSTNDTLFCQMLVY